MAFAYSETEIIKALLPVTNEGNATINLVGLNRAPGGDKQPTDADTRWIFRLQAWLIAKMSYRNWQVAPSTEMANQIGLTAAGTGFYSVWMTVFAGVSEVKIAIQQQFPNTYFATDVTGIRIVRPNGIV